MDRKEKAPESKGDGGGTSPGDDDLRAAHAELQAKCAGLEEKLREQARALEAATRRVEQLDEAMSASERRFRAVSDLTSRSYTFSFALDEALQPTLEWLAEPGFLEVTGFERAEIDAAGPGVIFHPEDLHILEEVIAAMVAGQSILREFRIVTKSGEVRWIRSHTMPEWDAAKQRVIRIHGASHDITERRAAEKAALEQERFLGAVLDTVGAMVGVVDYEGRIVRFNRACERTFGYAADEVRGRHFWELLPLADEVEPAERLFKRLVAGRWAPSYDTYWFTRAGERICLAWSTTFLRNEAGEVEYVIGTGIDITERNKAAAVLQEREEYWRALIEKSTDLIAILGEDMMIRYVSSSLERLLGQAPSDWIGRNGLEFVHPDDTGAVIAALQSGIEHRDTGEPMSFRVRHADGSWRVFEGTDTNLLEDPAVGGIVVNIRDVTERSRAEQRTAVLLEVAGLIAHTRDRDELLKKVEQCATTALACNAVSTFVGDDGHGFGVISSRGLPPLLRGSGKRVSRQELFSGPMARGEAVLVNDPSVLPPWIADVYRSLGISTMIVAPLVVRDRHLGALVAMRTNDAPAFGTENLDLAKAIAQQVALALDALELYRIQQNEAQTSAALAHVGRELISALDRPALLERLCELTAAVLGCDFSHTYVLDPDDGAFVAAYGFGDTAEQWESIRLLRIDRTVAPALLDRLTHEDCAEVGPNDAENPLLAARQQRHGIGVKLYVALRVGEQPMALLTAGYRDGRAAFTLEQQRIARGVAQVASLALHNTQLFEKLETANRLKSDFMASMSHELRTPLNIIIGYNDLLLESAYGDLSAEQSATLRRTRKTACELLELIQHTLDVTRLEAGPSPLQVGELDLDEIVQQIERETEPLWSVSGIEFCRQIDPGLPIIRTDVVKLKVVLSNLIGNAIKFTERGGVTVTAEPLRGGLEIRVSDTGVGIERESLETIFEQFHQADHGDRRFDGLGLGLYIVRRLLDLLGGSIVVDSEVGRGSEFRLWIPDRSDVLGASLRTASAGPPPDGTDLPN